MRTLLSILLLFVFTHSLSAAIVTITTQMEWDTYIASVSSTIPATDEVIVTVNIVTAVTLTNNGSLVIGSGITFDHNAAMTNSVTGLLMIIGTYDGFGALTNNGTIINTGTFTYFGSTVNNPGANVYSCTTLPGTFPVHVAVVTPIPEGTPCNDGDPDTEDDEINDECECVGTPATPTGACCMDDGSCDILSEEECMTAEGNYQGDDTTCPSPTTYYEDKDGDGYTTGETMTTACQPDGFRPLEELESTVIFDCDDEDADITIPGTSCDDGNDLTIDDTLNDDCECVGTPIGACCMDDGSCSEMTMAECMTDGGDYQGDLISCPPLTTYYEDLDGDGYHSGNTMMTSCPPTGFRPLEELNSLAIDCDDSTADVTIPGSPCDDGDDLTVDDFLNENCECVGGAAIPTMSQWGIILLSIIMLIIGIIAVRNRKTVLEL